MLLVRYICMMKYLIAFWIFWAGYQTSLWAQELNCTVEISTVSLQSDKTIFEAMKKSITEFMNTTKWTSDVYGGSEKIDCSIFLNIQERQGANDFVATIQVQCRRPVYSSSYNSTLMLHNPDDKFKFTYTQFDPLVFTENTYTGELTAILSYYAYLILGFDYDSFSPLGGTPHFEKALNVCNISQALSKNTGWKPGDDGGVQKNTSRYTYVNNLLDPFFKPLRECSYIYHRNGLDKMFENNAEGTLMISKALEKLDQIHATKPNNYTTQQFFYAKSDELCNLYKAASMEEKTKAVQLLKKLNPGNNIKYTRILSER